MPKRSNDFQKLVFLLQSQLQDQNASRVTESKELIDRNTGKSREGDIVVEYTMHGIPCVLAFECADRERPGDITWVEQQVQKHSTLSDKLVLVTRAGVSQDAADLARRHGVEIITVADATEIDWLTYVDRYSQLRVATIEMDLRQFNVDAVPTEQTSSPSDIAIETCEISFGEGIARVPIADGILELIQARKLGEQVMRQWCATPPKDRKSVLSAKFQATPGTDWTWTASPPGDAPAMRIEKISGVVEARMGEAPLPLSPLQFHKTNVAHAVAVMPGKEQSGDKLHLLLTSDPGDKVKARAAIETHGQPLRQWEFDPDGDDPAGRPID